MVEDFLDFALRRLVLHPEEIVVTCREADQHLVVAIEVAQDDLPRVLGPHGRTISSIRSLVNCAAARRGLRATVQVAGEMVEPSPADDAR